MSVVFGTNFKGNKCCFKIYKIPMRSLIEYCTQPWASVSINRNWGEILKLEGIQ